MMHLPLSYINQLYLIAEQREKTKEGQERREGEVLEDELEEAMV
jgi:hypothetical protein